MTYISPTKVLAHIDRIAAWQKGEKPAPVTIEWDLSFRCDLGCTSCHFAYTHVGGPWTKMPRRFPLNHDAAGKLADAQLVTRVLREVQAAGVEGIVWTGGGEPTTHPQWQQIVAAAALAGLEQGMYTHGGLLTPASGALLADHATWVVVSLDHLDAASYARWKHVPPAKFEAACNGIVSLIGHRAIVGVSFLLHAQNWTQAREMVRCSRDLGAQYTTFRPTIHTSPDQPGTLLGDRSWVSEALPLLEQLAREPDVEIDPQRFVQLRDWAGHGYDTCRGITLNTTITPDGRVWVCPNRREYPNSCLGDLRVESFTEIWARHPGQWTDFRDCRAMCRLHAVNQQLVEVHRQRPHEAFV